MPVINNKFKDNFIKLEIYEEVVRARVNSNSRYSFLKREVLEDLNIFIRSSAVNITVSCNGKTEAANFILENFPENDALLGSDFIAQFNIQLND